MGCGETVDIHIVEKDGKAELRCLNCGLTLKVIGASESPKPVETMEAEESDQIILVPLEEVIEAWTIIIADDSDFLREFMKKLILKKGLAHEVIACRDGQEFITEATKALAQDKGVDLVVLDLEMPNMDGITAARALRAVEMKFEAKRKIPILFFSVRRCDEGLKKQLARCAPATYINKGADSSPEQLTNRVDQLIRYLLKKRAGKGG